MNKKSKEYINCDISRYYGIKKRSLASVMVQGYQIPYLKALRHASFDTCSLTGFFWRWKLRRLQIKSGMQIPRSADIGRGLYIGYTGSIAVNEKAIIGENCNITSGVVIGADNRGKRKGAPTLGDKVWVGTNAVIVGKISIGNDVMIAPNSFINFDVPSHSIVIGNPATVIHRDNATEGFINNAV